MKRTLAALMAALLLLALTACKPKQEPEPTPEPPAVTEPDTPAPEPTPKPEPTPETPDLGLQAELSEYVLEDSVEELVDYRLAMPQVTLPNAEAAEIINQYYKNQAAKLADLAWGEAYEQAISSHTNLELSSANVIGLNQNGIFSVRRHVQLLDVVNANAEGTLLAETFSLESGGLLTLDDVFTVPPETYMPRLLELLRQDTATAGASMDLVEGWESQLETCFEKSQFCLTEQGLEIFYQTGEIEAYTSWCVTISWQDIADITKQP